MSPRLLMIALLAGVCLWGQIGGPYPGGGYPPGGYPPGSYPPGSYPPGSYPGGGVGIPMPGGRSKKTKESNKPAISLSGKIAKQDGVKSTVTIESDDGRNIDLRITNDTKINGESGKLSAADLHVGDEISIQAHTDDKGYFFADTIRLDKSTEVNTTSDAKSTSGAKSTGEDPDDHRPILKRAPSSDSQASTSSDKSAGQKDTPAAKDTSRDKSPSKAGAKQDDEYETGEEHPILPAGGVPSASSSASSDPDRPILRRGAPQRSKSSEDAAEEKPVEVASAKPSPSPGASSKNDEPEIHYDSGAKPLTRSAEPGDEFIEKSREAVFEFDQKLPNFVCQQQVTRYESVTHKPDWHALDVVSYDLVYEDGKEQYKNPKINGKVVKEGADKDSGSWSSGEFGTLLKDVFHPGTAAIFRAKGQETINHHVAKVYSFTVDKDHSHWRVQGGTQWIMPAYKGTIWIDKESNRALRIEMEAINIPTAFILDHVETAADYDSVSIKEQRYLLPIHAEVLSCERGTFNCSRNAIDFRNYHAYTGESSITFGNQ